MIRYICITIFLVIVSSVSAQFSMNVGVGAIHDVSTARYVTKGKPYSHKTYGIHPSVLVSSRYGINNYIEARGDVFWTQKKHDRLSVVKHSNIVAGSVGLGFVRYKLMPFATIGYMRYLHGKYDSCVSCTLHTSAYPVTVGAEYQVWRLKVGVLSTINRLKNLTAIDAVHNRVDDHHYINLYIGYDLF